jgi:hypothetical protein
MTPVKAEIARATWTGRDDRFYVIVTYDNGAVRHDCRAIPYLSACVKARRAVDDTFRPDYTKRGVAA